MSFRRLAILLLVFPALSSCCSPYSQSACCSPMECSAAKEGFVRYEPAIEALAQYRQDHGDYPLELTDLTPKYLAKIAKRENGKLTYAKNDKGYLLAFTYYGPGANRCWYGSEDMKWNCAGHF